MRASIIFLLLLSIATPYIVASPQNNDGQGTSPTSASPSSGTPSTPATTDSKCSLASCIDSTGVDKSLCPTAFAFQPICPCKSNYAGSDASRCDICAEGFTEFPVCKRCSCNPAGSTGGAATCTSSGSSCQCKPGYTGKDCFSCDNGFWQFKTSNCKACDCDASGTEMRGCDVANGQCLCKVGFTGQRCDQCAPGFSNYPECNGALVPQNAESFYGLFGAVALGAFLFFFLRWKIPHADNVFALILTIWLAKLAADIGFVAQKVRTPMASSAVAFIFIPMVVNLISSLVIMAREAANSRHFQIWINRNTYLGMLLSLLAVGGVEILLLGQSRLFGWDALTAPFSDYRIGTIQLLFTAGVALMNVPQLAYLIYVVATAGRDKRDVFAVFCLFATATLVLYGVISRVYMVIANKRHQHDMAAQVIAKSGIDARHSKRFDMLDDDYIHEKQGRTHLPMNVLEETTSRTSSIATHIQLPASVVSVGDDTFMSDNEIMAIYHNVNTNSNQDYRTSRKRDSITSRLRSSTSLDPQFRASIVEPPSPTSNSLTPGNGSGRGSSGEERRQRPISLVIVADADGNVRPQSVFGEVPPSPRPNMPPPRPPGLESAAPSRATSIEINIMDHDHANENDAN